MSVASEAGQQRVKGSFTDDKPVYRRERTYEIKSVPLLLVQQRKDAIFERPAPQLAESVVFQYHASQGT